MSDELPCDPCVEFRRGERDNLTYLGIQVHVCKRKRDGDEWDFASCPCGCAKRKPGLITEDRALYGNAFLGSRGERIDPTTVRSTACDYDDKAKGL